MTVEPVEFIREARAELAAQLAMARAYGRMQTWVGKRPTGSDDEVLTEFLKSSTWPFPRFEDRRIAGFLNRATDRRRPGIL